MRASHVVRLEMSVGLQVTSLMMYKSELDVTHNPKIACRIFS